MIDEGEFIRALLTQPKRLFVATVVTLLIMLGDAMVAAKLSDWNSSRKFRSGQARLERLMHTPSPTAKIEPLGGSVRPTGAVVSASEVF